MAKALFGIPGKPAPNRCRCGKLFPKPVYGGVEGYDVPIHRINPNEKGRDVHHIRCTCGIVLVWTFPNVWKEHIPDPIKYVAQRYAALR